jgi:hypothetical protein
LRLAKAHQTNFYRRFAISVSTVGNVRQTGKTHRDRSGAFRGLPIILPGGRFPRLSVNQRTKST